MKDIEIRIRGMSLDICEEPSFIITSGYVTERCVSLSIQVQGST